MAAMMAKTNPIHDKLVAKSPSTGVLLEVPTQSILVHAGGARAVVASTAAHASRLSSPTLRCRRYTERAVEEVADMPLNRGSGPRHRCSTSEVSFADA
jgi:hypothetical protein